jgi:hypothetical protein
VSPVEFALTWILAVAGLAPAQTGPPRIAGIALGSTAAEVVRAVGRPDRDDESLGIRFWDYKARGLTLMWHEGEVGLQGFVLRDASAGPLEGVRVGDTIAVLDRKWGTPSRVRQEGRYRDFAHAEWVISAEVARGRVMSLTVLRVRAPD